MNDETKVAQQELPLDPQIVGQLAVPVFDLDSDGNVRVHVPNEVLDALRRHHPDRWVTTICGVLMKIPEEER